MLCMKSVLDLDKNYYKTSQGYVTKLYDSFKQYDTILDYIKKFELDITEDTPVTVPMEDGDAMTYGDITGFYQDGHQYYQVHIKKSDKHELALYRDDYYVWHMTL